MIEARTLVKCDNKPCDTSFDLAQNEDIEKGGFTVVQIAQLNAKGERYQYHFHLCANCIDTVTVLDLIKMARKL